jgi:hypothetical protein
VMKCPTSYALSDGTLGDAQPTGGVLYGHAVYPASTRSCGLPSLHAASLP